MIKIKSFILILLISFLYSCAPSSPVAEQPTQPTPIVPSQVNEVHEVKSIEQDYPLIEPGRFDNGKMWTFEYPPVEYFLKEYNLNLTEEWVKHAQMGSVRLPNCTGSFVSSIGLILTNHHCTRDEVIQVTAPGENLTKTGFYAQNLSDERKIEDYYVDQLIDIVDVTERVKTAISQAHSGTPLDRIISEIEMSIEDEYDLNAVVEIVGLYNDALYSAYVFRRFEDIRLVMVPELEVGYFGGDPDNFTYPRYVLDMALLRAYENDEPYESEYWFNWSREGAAANEPVFVVGNPGSTSRLFTMSQLEYTRDVTHPSLLWLFNNVTSAINKYLNSGDDISEEEQVSLQNLVFQILNGIKAYNGGLKALHSDEVMGRRFVNENKFKEMIQADSEISEVYGSVHSDLVELINQQRKIASNYSALFALSPGVGITSGLLQRALMIGLTEVIYEMDNEDLLETARWYTSMLDFTTEWAPEIEKSLITGRITYMLEMLDIEERENLEMLMNGKSPGEYADFLVNESMLATLEGSTELLTHENVLADPAVQFGYEFAILFESLNGEMSQLQAQEEDLNRLVGRAHYAVYGTEFPPDATFSPRFQDGRVLSYDYNGTIAPVNTTFFGMFDRYYSHGQTEPWTLPDTWKNLPFDFDLSTPLNIVSTNDIIGGNSGSPLLNMNLELVGLIFDGNIESLVSDFIYLEKTSRAISVDVRGMAEALRAVYGTERILEELFD